MAKKTVKIKGQKQLSTKLKKIANRLEVTSKQLDRRASRELASRIRRVTPVDTGALQNSVEALDNGVTIGGGPVDYAEIVEARQPFIEPTVREFRNDYVQMAREDFGDAIK